MSCDAEAKLCAIITAYRPDDRFGSRFADIRQICRAIVVVDNTPGGHRFDDLDDSFTVLQDGRNKGLGQALNLGIERAVDLGCDTVVLFDQDSTPSAPLLVSLLSRLALAGGLHTGVGPALVDDQRSAASHPAKPSRDAATMVSMTCLPTSGMVFSIGTWPQSPHFSEDLFLDLVDFDWCWRMRCVGWRFYKATDIKMPHRLGLAERRLLGMTYHVPAPYRHYFQFRDTLRVASRRYVPMYSKVRLVGLLPLKILAYPWLLDRGLERLRWMLLGVADALRGRSGAGAAAAKLGA